MNLRPSMSQRSIPPRSPKPSTGSRRILQACVHEGASIGFVMPFDHDEARAYWLDRVAPAARGGRQARPHRDPRRRDRRNGAARSRFDAEQAPSRRGVQGPGRSGLSPRRRRPRAHGGDRTARGQGRPLAPDPRHGGRRGRSPLSLAWLSPRRRNSALRARRLRGPLRRDAAHVQRPAPRDSFRWLKRT